MASRLLAALLALLAILAAATASPLVLPPPTSGPTPAFSPDQGDHPRQAPPVALQPREYHQDMDEYTTRADPPRRRRTRIFLPSLNTLAKHVVTTAPPLALSMYIWARAHTERNKNFDHKAFKEVYDKQLEKSRSWFEFFAYGWWLWR